VPQLLTRFILSRGLRLRGDEPKGVDASRYRFGAFVFWNLRAWLCATPAVQKASNERYMVPDVRRYFCQHRSVSLW
jgi:hypothetical protein